MHTTSHKCDAMRVNTCEKPKFEKFKCMCVKQFPQLLKTPSFGYQIPPLTCIVFNQTESKPSHIKPLKLILLKNSKCTPLLGGHRRPMYHYIVQIIKVLEILRML